MYLDANNLYGWGMSQKLPTECFKWIRNLSKIDEEFIKNYDNDDDIGFVLTVDIEYPKELHDLHSDLQFFTRKMKINKCNKLVCTLNDKRNYVAHIRNIKQALKQGLKLKKIHKAIAFYQEAWLKPYIDMNPELRKNAKNDFEKDFYRLMNNAVFEKTMENVRKHGDIKLVTSDKKVASKPNYYTKKWFSESFLAIQMNKTKVKTGFSILEISKKLMYEFWHDYMNSKYKEKGKLRYTDIDRFINHIKTKDFYKDMADDVDKRFDTSNYKCCRPLPTGKNKKVIGFMKDELR